MYSYSYFQQDNIGQVGALDNSKPLGPTNAHLSNNKNLSSGRPPGVSTTTATTGCGSHLSGEAFSHPLAVAVVSSNANHNGYFTHPNYDQVNGLSLTGPSDFVGTSHDTIERLGSDHVQSRSFPQTPLGHAQGGLSAYPGIISKHRTSVSESVISDRVRASSPIMGKKRYASDRC